MGLGLKNIAISVVNKKNKKIRIFKKYFKYDSFRHFVEEHLQGIIEMNKDHITLELDKVIRMLEKRCMSVLGKALASELTPATTLDNAKALVLQTEDAYTLISRFGSPSFDGVKNVAHSLARANAGGMLTMRELLDISSVLKCVHNVLDWRSHCENMNNSLDRYFEVLTDLPSLERKISSSILSEDEMHDNASPELFRIRRKIISAENKVRDKLDSIIRSDASKGCLQEAVVTIRNGRYVVPVKAEFRSHISGLIHDTSSSGSTVFIEPMAVVNLNNEYKELLLKEKEVYGIYLSNHPTTMYKKNNPYAIPINEVENHFDKQVDTLLLVDKVKLVNL